MTKKEMQKRINTLEEEVAFLRELVRMLTHGQMPQTPTYPTPTPWQPLPRRTNPVWPQLPWDIWVGDNTGGKPKHWSSSASGVEVSAFH